MALSAEIQELIVKLSLHDGLTSGVNKALGSVGKLDKGIGRSAKGVGQLSKGVLKAGAVFATVAGTGLAIAAKTAIEFDDAFAGVRKTVSASEPELQALNDQLHALATRIPVKYTDLAEIAAEAGALGVPTKQVANFTEIVARLSASTVGLSTGAAAEAFGKFRNTLHLADADMSRAASSLIALGNAGASSEGDIIEVAKRFGAAGHQAGLSAAQVLGFSSAIASLGVEPEAAGSSLSRLFNNITKYLGTGDKKINAFAKTSGKSVAQFKKLFAHDATGAVETFLTGLSKLNRFQAANVLKNAGINNVRDINAVLLLSQNVGELKRQVGLSSDAFAKNTDLTDVSTKRFDTLKNKLILVKQNFLEAGYNIAEGFLPALGRAADKLTKFLQLPENKKSLIALGEKLGETLDKIDFGKLLTAAKGAADVLQPMVDALVTIAGILNSLPAEVKGAGLAAIVANKASGGLIGAGLGNIIGGLGSTLAKSLAASIPLFGRAFVQPVFVTNLGGIGGGGGGLSNAAGQGSGKFLLSAAAIGSIVAVAATYIETNNASTQQAQGLQAQLNSVIKSQNPAQQAQDLAAIRQGIHDIESNPLSVLVRGDALNTLKAMEAQLANTPQNVAGPAIVGRRGAPVTIPKSNGFAAIGQLLTGAFRNGTQQIVNATTHNPALDRLSAKINTTARQLHAAQRAGDRQDTARLQGKLDRLIHKRTSVRINNVLSNYISVRDTTSSSTFHNRVARSTSMGYQ